MVTDAQSSPWRESQVLGRMLDRSEALKHPLLADVFHITDHIVNEDAPLKAHLDGKVAA